MSELAEALKPLQENLPIQFVEVVGFRRKNRKVVKRTIKFGTSIICLFGGVHGTWEVWHVAARRIKVLGMRRYTRVLWMSVVNIRDLGDGRKEGLILSIIQPGAFYVEAAKKMLGQCLNAEHRLNRLY